MMSQVVQDTIKSAVEMGDYSPLYDYFADDVELKVAMAVGSPVSDERCKPSVIGRLQQLGEFDMPRDGEAPEFIASGERVVAFWDESVALRSGMAIRVQCTLVFDIRDGLIARLAIHHDLSPIRASRPERRARRDARTAGPVVNGQQRNRAVGSRAG